MFNLVIFGPPGSGKGTQSEKIIEKYGLTHLSTGDILRSEIQSGSALGKKASELISKGELVPDEMVQEMVKTVVHKNIQAKGFIFDGFPRTRAQAVYLDDMLGKRNVKVNLMLALTVEENELKERLLNRGKLSGRADDQNETIIANRIKVYNEQTEPVMDYYEKQGKLYKVEGSGAIDIVFERICLVIDKLKQG